ncbi:MAG: phage baseplate assembly protein V [Gammaproteobacteria bacterium]
MELARVLARRIRMIAGRAVINLANDALKVQSVQISALDTEVLQAQRFQEYGFTSVPLAGAEGIFLAIAGVRGHTIVIASDDGRYRRKNLQPGEVALYTDEGDYIQLARGKKIQVVSGGEVDVTGPNVNVMATSKITCDTPELHCTGKITAADEISSDVDCISAGVSGKGHLTTGVQSGGDLSGPPEAS